MKRKPLKTSKMAKNKGDDLWGNILVFIILIILIWIFS